MRQALAFAALVAASIIPAVGMAAEPLGRLFFTPTQRHVLDAGKYAGTPAPVTPAPRTVHLDGVVTRSDAERTVWINGRAYHDRSPDGVQVKTSPAWPGNAEVRVPGQALAARVKVGQQIDLNSGKVRDSAPREPQAEETTAAPMKSGAAQSSRAQNKSSERRPPGVDENGGDHTAAASR